MTIHSPHRPVPLSGLRLTEFVLANAAELGDKPAIIDGTTGRAISYRELKASVARCAAALTRRGVTRGDVLALAGPNSPGYAIVFHAAAMAGAAVTTINPLAPAAEMARQLRGFRRPLACRPAVADAGQGPPGRRRRPGWARRPRWSSREAHGAIPAQPPTRPAAPLSAGHGDERR